MRKNMKKATAFLIVAAMAAGLSACSSGGDGETKAPSGTQAADSGTSLPAAESAPGKEEAAKTASDEKVGSRYPPRSDLKGDEHVHGKAPKRYH